MINKINTLFSKLNSTNFTNVYNSISSIASFGKIASSNSLFKTIYDVLFDKPYEEQDTFYINLNKIATAKEPLSDIQKYYLLQKISTIIPNNIEKELADLGKSILAKCEECPTPTDYTIQNISGFGLCACAGKDLFLCNPLTKEPLSLKIKANALKTDKQETSTSTQAVGIAENTNADVSVPQNLTDQSTNVNVDFEGKPSVENSTDEGQEAVLPTQRVLHAGFTFVERDGLYDVYNTKGTAVKKGLELIAALNLIALTNEDKVELNDQRGLEETFMDASGDEMSAKEKNEHKDLNNVNVNTGVETKVEKSEDRANNFSTSDFFDMFRKLEPAKANEVLEKIREKVSGETGAEAYNFLLKVKDNGWDFSKTYKETADGQSEKEIESERKEQSKKLARSIEKLIEEDKELSEMLGYKNYLTKKDNKTAQ